MADTHENEAKADNNENRGKTDANGNGGKEDAQILEGQKTQSWEKTALDGLAKKKDDSVNNGVDENSQNGEDGKYQFSVSPQVMTGM